MAFSPKTLISNYFKKKKPIGIFFDAVFVVLLLLLLIPATRKETAAFFIKLTSFPASTLDEGDQFRVNAATNQWQLYDLDGDKTSFEDLNKKPVFLNIWATWCPPCIAELPSIEELHQTFGADVSFILVSNEDPALVKAFAEKHNYGTLPFYYSNSVPADFSSNSIPTTFIIDQNGLVMVNKKGAARWNSSKTEKLLEQLINQ
jgi:thiol-disulfide isomerase/thioredoxin